MDKKEILDFINNNMTCYMATVDEGKPRVRGIGTYSADESGIVLQLSEPKDVYKQLIKNPETELCFANPKEGIQVRVSGRLEPDENPELKKAVIEKRPFLKPMVDQHGIDFIKMFRLKHGKALVWTFKANFDPKVYVEL